MRLEFDHACARQDPSVAPGALLRAGDDVATCDPTGDTALELLLAGAARVRVVTTRRSVAALVALKVAALRGLPPSGARDALGAGPIGRRLWFFHTLRPLLAPEFRAWWDERERVVREGVLASGRWEHRLAGFRRSVLPRVHDAAEVHALLSQESREQARAFVLRRWRTLSWRVAVMGWFFDGYGAGGRHAGPTARALETQILRAMLASLPGDSPPLVGWLTGRWDGGRGTPRWLTDAAHPVLRERLDRLTVVSPTELADSPADAIDLHEHWELASDVDRAGLWRGSCALVKRGGPILLRASVRPDGFCRRPLQRLEDAWPFALPAWVAG